MSASRNQWRSELSADNKPSKSAIARKTVKEYRRNNAPRKRVSVRLGNVVRLQPFWFRALTLRQGRFSSFRFLFNPTWFTFYFFRSVLFDAATANRHTVSMQRSVMFLCPTCGAKYRVTSIEASTEPTRPIACISCGEPLSGHDGAFFLKYFLIERPKRAQAAPLQAS
jgi:predicted RNA-binding Zn-ribbon protein involved in translation (DUF1610 family)